MPGAESPLAAWQTYYVIVGSSSAALTGLMFVVITLMPRTTLRPTGDTIAAFSTPNIVHFCAALLLGALLSAPWDPFGSVAIPLVATGVAGVLYVAVVTRRALRQSAYQPVLEDWIWHSWLPFVSYGAVAAAGILLASHPHPALFVIGGAALLLLFIGIHNAWDTVTFMALRRLQAATAGDDGDDGDEAD